MLKFIDFTDIIYKNKYYTKDANNFIICVFLFSYIVEGIMVKSTISKSISRWWNKKMHIIIITILFIILGALYTYYFVKPDYASATTLMLSKINSSAVGETDLSKNVDEIVQSEFLVNDNMISTYNELIKSNTCIRKVIRSLGITMKENELKKAVHIKRVSKTNFIQIIVANEDPILASEIANEMAKVFSEKVREIYHIDDIYNIDLAVPSEMPYNVHHIRDILLFGIVGFMVSCGYIGIIVKLDTRIKSHTDIETEEVGLQMLMRIPITKEKKYEVPKQQFLIDENGKTSATCHAFKTLRTNVQFSNRNEKNHKVILITSCFPLEGKSYIATNLSIAFAKAGKKVMLIDADMRHNTQAQIFQIGNALGLSNYLSNLDDNGMEIKERINQFIHETSIKNLNVITAGTLPPNPSELLNSDKLNELIKDLCVFYDYIIFDGTPIVSSEDSLILTRMVHETILVTLYNKTKKKELCQAKEDIEKAGGKIIGVVINKVTMQQFRQQDQYENYDNYHLHTKNRTPKIHCKRIKISIHKIKEYISRKIQKYKKQETKLLSSPQEDDTTITHLNKKQKKNQENTKENEQMIIESFIRPDTATENKQVTQTKVNKKIQEKMQKFQEVKNNKLQIIKQKQKTLVEKREERKQEKAAKEAEILKEKEKERVEREKEEKILAEVREQERLEKQKEKEAFAKKIEEEKKQKQEEKMQLAKIKEAQAIARKERLEKLAKLREEEKQEKERNRLAEKHRREVFKQELNMKRMQEKEEKRRAKEMERQRQKEEERIQEELLEDNLYPKTKYNKSL